MVHSTTVLNGTWEVNRKMTKTYIPTANNKAADLNRYFAKWAAQMSVGASADQLTALANLIACIATFLQKWPKPPPVD